jgi:hypothetical protein
MTQHFLALEKALRRGAILGDDAMTMSHSRTPSVRECKQAGRGIFEQVILTPPIEREDLLSRIRKARQPVTFIHQIRPSRPVQYLSDNCHTRWFVLDQPAYPQLYFSQQRHSPNRTLVSDICVVSNSLAVPPPGKESRNYPWICRRVALSPSTYAT